jgi:hypothetical protein
MEITFSIIAEYSKPVKNRENAAAMNQSGCAEKRVAFPSVEKENQMMNTWRAIVRFCDRKGGSYAG